MPQVNKTLPISIVCFSLLSLSCVELAVFCGSVRSQASGWRATDTAKTTPPAPGERIFVATLARTLDARKVKAGTAVIAYQADSIDPSSPGNIVVLGRVLDSHASGKGNADSLLLLRFDKVRFGNNQEVSGHLKLQAVAAPLATRLLTSPAMVDRFPCDDDAHHKECLEAKKQNQIADLGLEPIYMNICRRNPAKGKGQARDICVPAAKAHGIYGFPDLSLSPYPADSEQGFAIVSKSKNIQLERNTVFVFSSSDIRIPATPQP